MAKQKGNAYEMAHGEGPSPSGSSADSGGGKFGKTFLLIGIVLVQVVAAYALINKYYPAIKSFTARTSTDNYVYYEFKNIVVNTAGSQETHFLVMDLSIKTDDQDALSTLKLKKDEVKDRINILMSHYNIKELKSSEKRAYFKKKLAEAINRIAGKNMVRNLFFTRFVLQ